MFHNPASGPVARPEEPLYCPRDVERGCGDQGEVAGSEQLGQPEAVRHGRGAPQGPRQSRDLSGSYQRRVGPVSGGRQLGVWRRESDWRPTRTFRYCARVWPWRRSVVACRLHSSQPWDVFGAYRPPEPSDWLGGIACVQLPRDRAARWWFAPVVPPRGRNRARPSPREEPPCLPACQRSSTSLPSSASLGARSRDWAAPRSRPGSI